MELDIPVEFWQRHRLVPLNQENGRLTVGIDESTPIEVLEDVRLTLNKDVRPVRMSTEEIDDALRRLVLNTDSPSIDEAEDENSVSLDPSSDSDGRRRGRTSGAIDQLDVSASHANRCLRHSHRTVRRRDRGEDADGRNAARDHPGTSLPALPNRGSTESDVEARPGRKPPSPGRSTPRSFGRAPYRRASLHRPHSPRRATGDASAGEEHGVVES